MRILLALVFIHAFLLSDAQTPTGRIQGTVTSQTRKSPIAGVIITLNDTGTSAATNSKGVYSFNIVQPGTYTLVATCVGYVRDTFENVVVNPEQTAVLNFQLTPEVRYEQPYTPVNKKIAFAVGTAQTALVTGSLIGLHQLWYKQYPRENFHTFNDAAEWCQMDKLGHFQSSYTIAKISTQLWCLSNVNHKRASWIGTLTSFGYLTAIEIMDGYSTGWGFSAGDMIANTGGSALFITQQLCFRKQIVLPKFGFAPSPYAQLRPELLGKNFTEQLLKDYNGQTYWLSVNVASFMSDRTRFPNWLNVAVGYGANGMTGGHENPVMYNSAGNLITVDRYRQYYLSLDIDLHRIPTRSRFLRLVLDTLNFIKIPAPAIEVDKYGVHGYIIKF